jgi:hypothetical protein
MKKILSLGFGGRSGRPPAFPTGFAAACAVFLFARLCAAQTGPVVTLSFEGLQDNEEILNYYNGGYGGNGTGLGPNYGITFGSDSLAIITQNAGGSGNFSGNPSGTTIAYFVSGPGVVMNVPAGFQTGFAFYFSSGEATGSVTVYDGAGATGNILAQISLPATGTPCNGSALYYSCWQQTGVTFQGTAKSVNFSGVANEIGFDNITLGTSTATPPLVITTTSLPSGALTAAYNAPLTATGGTTPYAWSWAASANSPTGLPPGLTVANGAISGTPTAAGTYSVVLTVKDSTSPALSATSAQPLTLIVSAAPLKATCTPQSGTYTPGAQYSLSCTASGGTAPYTWSNSALPAWLQNATNAGATVTFSGTVPGAPPNSYSVTFTATDSTTTTKQTASSTVTINVSAATLKVTCSASPAGTVGTSFSAAPCTASGGTTSYTWNWSGTTPPGLSINSGSGAIGGTPTTAGSYPVTVTVTDSTTPTKQTASATVTINVVSALLLTCNPLSGPVMAGVSYTAVCTASGGAPGYTFSLGGSLPGGLGGSAAATTATISGKPAGPGAYSYTVTATDTVGQTASQSFSGTIAAAPSVGSFSLTPVASTQQTASLTLASAPPVVLSGTLCLTFSANSSVVNASSYQSQEVVFANGTTSAACSSTLKTTLAFSIPAGSVNALWSGSSSQFSTGTVAGTITITVQSLVDPSGNSALPSPAPSQTITVQAGTPAVTGNPTMTVTSSAVTVVFDAATPTRHIAGVTYVFNPGAISVPVSFTSGAFNGYDQSQWFATTPSQATGGAFSLSATFPCTNCSSLTGVQVTLTN